METVNYRTLNDLNESTIKNIYRIPSTVDLVVAIPRSGMLLGSIIALHLNKQITTVDMLLRGEIIEHGTTRYIEDKNKYEHLLVVDDTTNTGRTISETKNKLQHINANITYLCAYVNKHSKQFVDVFFEEIEQPRIFQWNIMHSWFNRNSIYEIDGVLCENINEENNEIKYIEQIKNAKPKFIPYETIEIICSRRLEKYRDITTQWLDKNKVKYHTLIMRKENTQTKYDIYQNVIENNNCQTFFIPEYQQAKIIKNINPTKNVFCVDTMTFV